jgi:hypothetical protein
VTEQLREALTGNGPEVALAEEVTEYTTDPRRSIFNAGLGSSDELFLEVVELGLDTRKWVFDRLDFLGIVSFTAEFAGSCTSLISPIGFH